MKDQTPVLIIGAGPTGLTLANELARHGIAHRIIEKRSERTKTSNALAIHPRTMEMLYDMGIVDRFLKQGLHLEALSIHVGRYPVATILTNQIESQYNFILSLPQSETETILESHLNHQDTQVERGKTLHSFALTQEGVTANIRNENNEPETIKCRYLAACDGAHSDIRSLLKLPFHGLDLPDRFIVADAHIESPYPDNQVTTFLTQDGPFAIFPMKAGSARIVANLPNDATDKKQPISLLKIQGLAEKRSVDTIQVLDIKWASVFWIHSKMIPHLRHESIFFLGDAAHIHSPAGGQGMNTGMQDAYNLAWKLARVIRGDSEDPILNSYHEERHPIAQQVLKDTEKMTRVTLIKGKFSLYIKRILIHKLLKLKTIQRRFVMKLSQLTMHYQNSSIIDYQQHTNGLTPGQFAPGGTLIPDLKTTEHTLLIFTSKKLTEENVKALEAFHKTVSEFDNLSVVLITHPAITHSFSIPLQEDTSETLHHLYRVTRPCFYLVRPDKYIGCCSNQFDSTLLKNYFSTLHTNF